MMTVDQRGSLDAGGGVRLGYREAGSGTETIVVLQGGPGFTMDGLADDMLPLASKHTVIFYDQRGTGSSAADTAALDAQRFAEDLAAVRRHFSQQNPALLGHSWGAGVAALYAMRFAQHSGRLVIVDGIPPPRAALTQTFDRMRAGRDETWRNRLQECSGAWLADAGSAPACRADRETGFTPFFVAAAAMGRSKGDFCAGAPESPRNKIARVDRFVLASPGDYDWRPGLKQAHAPTLVVHGAADPIPVASAIAWAVVLTNARLVVMQGVGHFPYLEVPEAFFAAVEGFLRGQWPHEARAP